MSSKLFVGGLAWATRDETLKAHFDSCGEVTDAKVIMERDTGRSRGFGFVTFADEESASKAQAELNGSELDGRSIRVDSATERHPLRPPWRTWLVLSLITIKAACGRTLRAL
jgi:RNA recognition motif-containing protein